MELGGQMNSGKWVSFVSSCAISFNDKFYDKREIKRGEIIQQEVGNELLRERFSKEGIRSSGILVMRMCSRVMNFLCASLRFLMRKMCPL